MGRILLAVVLSCGSLVAQKMLLADDRERQVAVFAVPDLAGDQAAIAAPAGAGRFPGVERASLAEIADLLGSRARPGDHVEAVGPQHLVALGAPDWIGSVESMLVHLRGDGQKQVQVDTRFCRVSGVIVDRELERGLVLGIREATAGNAARTCILDRESATKLLRAIREDKGSRVVQAPQITAFELDRVTIKVGKDVSYVRGVELRGPSEQQVAVPVLDSIWNGDEANLVFAATSADKMSLSVRVQSQVVDLPLPEFQASAPVQGHSVAVQVPRTASCCATNCSEVTSGATLVVAARSSDGSWLLTLVTVQEIQSAGVQVLQRRR